LKKNKLYVPHIDKTGGQSVEIMLRDALDRAGWRYDINPGLTFLNCDSDNYARIGMHQEYNPEYITDDWFKLLVIREPLTRFVSAYNFFRFEFWRDHDMVMNLNVMEFVEFTHRRQNRYPVQAQWAMHRGYISSLTSLNAEQKSTPKMFTNSNIFEIFDVVTDTDHLHEIADHLRPLGLEVNTDVRVNVSHKHLVKTMGLQDDCVLTVDMLTSEELMAIESLPDFQSEVDLWERYIAYRG
jgi:hypothetical protein